MAGSVGASPAKHWSRPMSELRERVQDLQSWIYNKSADDEEADSMLSILALLTDAEPTDSEPIGRDSVDAEPVDEWLYGRPPVATEPDGERIEGYVVSKDSVGQFIFSPGATYGLRRAILVLRTDTGAEE